jgi:hypothetical protein
MGWEDYFKTDLKKYGVDWIQLTQNRIQEHAVVYTVINLLVPVA